MTLSERPIVHVITRLEPGGSARNTLETASAQAAGRKVVIVAGPHRNAEPPAAGAVGYMEVPDLTREISPLKDLRALFALRKIFLELEPAAVHTHTAKAGILGRWAARLLPSDAARPRPVIVHTPHGHVFYGYFGPLKTLLFLLAERVTAAVTDHFIALTEGEKRESIERGLGSEEDWTVIHSGVRLSPAADGGARAELGIAGDETVIATAARLEPVKGVEFFIRAAAELLKERPERKLRFLIVGDGSLRAPLERLAGELGAGGAVIFAGFRAEPLKYLACADIYSQPSLNEGMGRTAVEAQYLGLPVVASRVCGLPDVVEDGVTGLLVPPGEPEALAAAINSLISDPALRLRMGEAGKRRVLEPDDTGFPRFSAESMNVRMKRLYERILPGRDAARA